MKNTAKIEEIAASYQLELLLLFGSRVSEKTHKESDFDVAYLSKRDLTLMDESRLIIDLAPVFGSDNIDLVNLKRATPLLMREIFLKDNAILFCNDKKIYYRYKIYAERKFAEAKPLFELGNELIEKFIQKHA